MLNLIKTTETKQPVYAVTVSNRCSHLRPVLAESESKCIEVFAMEIIRCISEYEDNTIFFFNMFPELEKLYPDEDDIPTTEEIYSFLKDRELINTVMTKINMTVSMVNESNYYFTDTNGDAINYLGPIDITNVCEFRAIDHEDGCQYRVQRWDPTSVAIAVDKHLEKENT